MGDSWAGRGGRRISLVLLLAASPCGCGFAEVFCGGAAGSCEAEVVDVRTVAAVLAPSVQALR
jgi:hypothetical protein